MTFRVASRQSRRKKRLSVGALMAFVNTIKRSVPVLLIVGKKLTGLRCERTVRTGVFPFGAKPRPRACWPLTPSEHADTFAPSPVRLSA